MNDIMDMKISGSSAMPGGEYRTVSISGSGKVQGSLRCESLRCSGSARVQGDVDCAGEIRCSGRSQPCHRRHRLPGAGLLRLHPVRGQSPGQWPGP
mgnify:CR=1 FL=1